MKRPAHDNNLEVIPKSGKCWQCDRHKYLVDGSRVRGNCLRAALGKLKSMAASQNETIREFSVSGRPAWEEMEHTRGGDRLFERYVCGVGRYYVLSFVWPASESRPQLGAGIMDSFRLIKHIR